MGCPNTPTVRVRTPGSVTQGDGPEYAQLSGMKDRSDPYCSLLVVEGPFKVKYNSGAGTILTANPGMSYFVHSISMGARLEAANATTAVYVNVSVGAATKSLFLHTVPSAAGAYEKEMVLDILLDENTSLVFANQGGAPAQTVCFVTYKEVRG